MSGDSDDKKKRNKKIAIGAGGAAIAVLGAVLVWFLVMRAPDTEPIEVEVFDPPEFADYELVASRERLTLWSLGSALDVMRGDGKGPIVLACRNDVDREIRAIEAAGFDPRSVQMPLSHFQLKPQPISFVVLARTRTVVDSSTKVAISDLESSGARNSVSLIIGFADVQVETSSKFDDCVRESGSSAQAHSWPSTFLVGGLAVVGVNTASAKGTAGLAGTSRITIDLSSASMKYFQFGGSENLKIREILGRLEAPEGDPAVAAEAFRKAITSRAIIGTRRRTLAP